MQASRADIYVLSSEQDESDTAGVKLGSVYNGFFCSSLALPFGSLGYYNHKTAKNLSQVEIAQ